jgi:CheY-like chemotaxis protein
VISADSGSTALALLDFGERVDLLVSDLSMPGIDGITLIREAQRRRPGLPSVLLTGYASDAARVGARQDGGLCLMSKPVTLAQLTRKLNALLDNGTDISAGPGMNARARETPLAAGRGSGPGHRTDIDEESA